MALRRILVANRGEIALRIVRAARSLGIETTLAASAADRRALSVRGGFITAPASGRCRK